MNYGIPPKRRGQYVRTRKPVVGRPSVAETTARELDEYADTLMEFRVWCDDRGIPFKAGMVRAIAQYVQSMEH